MARKLLQTPAARRRRARARRARGGKRTGSGLPKAVVASAKAAAKAGRTTLPPTAVKAINAKIRAAKKSGSGLGDSIRTSQTAFRGNPMAQKLNSAGLGGGGEATTLRHGHEVDISMYS